MTFAAFFRTRLAVIALAAVFSATLVTPVSAYGAGHNALQADTDVCAMCHRSHTSASGAWFRDANSLEITRSALVVSTFASDKELCYSCHGTGAIGSDSDVQTFFEATASHHALASASSPYGPSPKECSDCHDSHGSEKTAAGTPYPSLLRSRWGTGTPVMSGEAFCGTCHTVRAGNRFDGLAIFRQTAHYSQISTPSSGTDIRCSVCHAPHGSTNTALVVTQLTTPNVAATYTVPANDRRFCAGCHSGSYGTYEGSGATYTASAHGESTKTVPVLAEYASAEATRQVGECQVCHDPMGRDDGTGKPIPKLAEKAGASLCYECHTAAGPASSDLQSLSYVPTSTALQDLVAAYSPATMTGAFGRVAAYIQDQSTAVPRSLVGPQEFETTGTVGRMAVGDVNGDGLPEVVLTDPSAARLTVFTQDDLRGLTVPSNGVYSIAASATAIGVANIFPTSDTQRPVIAVATGSTGGSLYLYRLGDGSAIDQLAGPIAIGDGPFSISAGDVTGSSAPDFVVTAHGSNQVTVVTDSGTGTASVQGPYATPLGPVSVAVGQVWAGETKEQIVVGCDSGNLAILRGDGTNLATYAAGGVAGASVRAVAVGNVLPADTGDEVVVSLGSPDTTGRILVYPQDTANPPGLLTPKAYDVAAHYDPSRLAIGDVDGDGQAELVVGNAGSGPDSTSPTSPSLQVYQPTSNGQDLGTVHTYVGGGSELAGAPDVMIADLKRMGPSRHPVDMPEAASHVSTETTPFAMHVTCTDCHEVHVATDETNTAAPAVYGALKGAMGVSANNISNSQVQLTGPQPAQYEYQVCFKCHSAFSGSLGTRRDVALDFDPFNASTHMVEPTGSVSSVAADSFVVHTPAWTNSSVLYCKDCHTDANASDPAGPHFSPDAPILPSPYLGVSPSDSSGFCYRCHKYDVYYSGTADAGTAASNFYNTDNTTTPATVTRLHAQHMRTYGLGCSSCHVGHGSATEPHLIRSDVGYVPSDTGGSCTNACHGSTQMRVYSR